MEETISMSGEGGGGWGVFAAAYMGWAAGEGEGQ